MNYTYMLECADGSYYIGWTNDLEKRVRTHQSGKGGRYTRSRLPVRLVYYEEYETPTEARKREAALKKLDHRERKSLLKGFSNRPKKEKEMTLEEKMAARREARRELNEVFGKDRFLAVPYFEDAVCYDVNKIVELQHLQKAVEEAAKEDRPALIEKFAALRDSIERKADAPERIYLWPEGKMPQETVYTDNSDYRYGHDPDFKPYIFEFLIPEDREPKGLVVVCAGGDHGEAVLHEGYQSCLDLNERGYQCLLLLNRVASNPWNKKDSGADSARAVQYARANAKRLRVKTDNIAFAGYSNGGLTGENCIEYFSGGRTMKDNYPDYEPDELDRFSGSPDCFLCIYGPRQVGMKFNWEGVSYPPTFFAVGRKDTAMDNLAYVLPDLEAHGVTVEIHTFGGVPHGQAGNVLTGTHYPSFDLWVPLSDAFMQDCYGRSVAEG